DRGNSGHVSSKNALPRSPEARRGVGDGGGHWPPSGKWERAWRPAAVFPVAREVATPPTPHEHTHFHGYRPAGLRCTDSTSSPACMICVCVLRGLPAVPAPLTLPPFGAPARPAR